MANEAGKPSWVDLTTSDLAGATEFYTRMFDWTAEVTTDPQAGGYTLFSLNGKQVGGAGPLQTPGMPTAWTLYVASDDADATAAKVQQAGGQVLVPPMDVMDVGRMAVFMDPTGAALATWQAGAHGGAEVFDEPGSLTWSELMTRDPEAAKAFYAGVFGWGSTETDMGGTTYTTFSNGEQTVAGMMAMVGDMWPESLPAHWMIYFAVDDCDASAALAEKLGGSVSVPPTTIPPGRFAVLGDPQGGFFSIIKNNPDYMG